jgi:hypothetical protein
MSVVERVEKEIAHSLLWNEETGTEHGASVPLSELRALLALVKACQYLTPDDWQKVITTVGMGAESQSLHYITQALTVVTGIDYETGYTALEAVTRGEG